MTSWLEGVGCPMTSWTLSKEGQLMECTLFSTEKGEYRLRLQWEGERFLEQYCTDPHEALAASLNAFHILVTHGWVHIGPVH